MLAISAIRAKLLRRKEAAEVDAGTAEQEPDREQVFLRDGDLKRKIKEQEQQRSTSWRHTLKLAYLSQGVIFGDISTSVLYAFGTVFQSIVDYGDSPEAQQQEKEHVLGVVSTLFWCLTLIALLKYAILVMQASDSGEGGTIALYAHLCRIMGISPFGTMKLQAHHQVLALESGDGTLERRPNIHRGLSPHAAISSSSVGVFKAFRFPDQILVLEGQNITRFFRDSRLAQHILLVAIMLSTGLAIADGIFMPAFTIYYPFSTPDVDRADNGRLGTGVACGVLVLVFLVQHIGTDKISFLFSPITIVFLLANAAVGIHSLAHYGGYVMQGLSPKWMIKLLVMHRDDNSWATFGSVVLCIAGAETMFAAMGNFSPASVSMAFCFFVYPCLVITYLGQGAFLINNPGEDPFWGSIPDAYIWPVWTLGLLICLVASQAAIASTFAMVRQATALGIFPRLRIIHTDHEVEGRIFIPFINYALMVCCIIFVAAFGVQPDDDGVSQLATIYAVSVVAVMLTTTFILLLTALVYWKVSLVIMIPVFLLYGLLESLFLAGVLYQAPPGSYIPLLIAFAVACIMYIWWSGSCRRRNALMQGAKGFDSSLVRVCPGAPSHHHRQLFPSLSNIGPTLSMSMSSAGLQQGFLSRAPSAGLQQGFLSRAPSAGLQQASLIRQPQGEIEAASCSTASTSSTHPPVTEVGVAVGSVSLRRSILTDTLYRDQADNAEYLALKGRPEQPLSRTSGLGLYYGESPVGMPLVMRHFLKNVDAIHEVCIILIVRFLPMPIVRSTERLLVRPVKNMPNFYQVVARYGYKDKVDHGDAFMSKLISTIMFKLEVKAGLKYQTRLEDFIQELEGDEGNVGAEGEEAVSGSVVDRPSEHVFGLPVIQESYLGEETKAQEEMAKWEAEQTHSPFISRYAMECLSRISIVATAPDATQAAKEALTAAQALLDMASAQVVHYRARTFTRPGNPPDPLHRLYNNTIGALYSMMESLAFSDRWQIPSESSVELGIAVEI